MKKAREIVQCSRCGDEISPEELALLHDTTCALCSEMQLEAEMIYAQKSKPRKPRLTVIGPTGINSQFPHPQS